MSKVDFQEKETEFRGGYQGRVFQTLLWSYSPFRNQILVLFILGFLGRLAILFNTNLIGHWVDSYCQGEHCRAIPSYLQGWSAPHYVETSLWLCLLGFIFILFFRVGFSRYSSLAISQFYDEVTYRTSRYPISFFDTNPAGRIITRFSSDYGNLFRLFGGPLAEFFTLLFDLAIMVILISAASPYFLVLVLFIASFNFFIYRHHKTNLRDQRRNLSRFRSPSIAHFSETAQGATTVRIYLKQKSFKSRFEILNDLFLTQRLITFKALTLFSVQINGLTAILLLITGLCSYFLLQINQLSVGSIGVALTFITLSGNTIQTFFEWLAQLDEALVGAERLDHYLHLPIEQGARLPELATFPTSHWSPSKPPPAPPMSLNAPVSSSGSIEIKNLSFRYRDDLPWILKDINLVIPSGQRLGIIGKTGSGKSTLIQCLSHLYPLTTGTISINGQRPYIATDRPPDENEIDLVDFRRLVNVIPQDPILFKGTLQENIAMADCTNERLTSPINQESLILALNRVGLGEWLHQQPQGIETPISERGKNLSLGERQLLCMARCLVQQSPVVIMDEATASVDPESERIMVEATQNFFSDRTQIIIAHRLSTLKKCDRILWLQEGRIHRLGTPKEILPEFILHHQNEVQN